MRDFAVIDLALYTPATEGQVKWKRTKERSSPSNLFRAEEQERVSGEVSNSELELASTSAILTLGLLNLTVLSSASSITCYRITSILPFQAKIATE